MRHLYDLGHETYPAIGEIGRLLTLTTLPVIAGETFEIETDAKVRLSQLRRPRTLTPVMDLFATYQPYRHTYDDIWREYIREGYDETQTFPGVAMPDPDNWYLQLRSPKTVPQWRVHHYVSTWNWFIRDPSNVADVLPDDYIPTDKRSRRYGLPVGHLPTPWSVGNMGTGDVTEDTLSTADDTLDIRALPLQKAILESEIDKTFKATRYPDIIAMQFGGDASIDADPRPRLIAHRQYPITLGDQAQDGERTSGGETSVKLYIPPFYCSEHGSIMVFAMVRFKSLTFQEIGNRFVDVVDMPWTEFAGNPDIFANSEPIDLVIGDYTEDGLMTGSSTTHGVVPYGEWFRYHQSWVHPLVRTVKGYPVIEMPSNAVDSKYIQSQWYDEVFMNDSFAHWHAFCTHQVDAWRQIPPGLTSIYTGTR